MNVDVVNRAIDFIVLHPERHFQGNWSYRSECRTTMCLAGTIVWQAGYQMVYRSREDADGGVYAHDCFKPGGLEMFDIEVLAANLAGLDDEQAHRLFYASDDAEGMALLWKNMKEEAIAG